MKIKKIIIACCLFLFGLFLVSCNDTKNYTIKFVDYDNTLLLEVSLLEGEMPVYSGVTPSRENNEQYSYTFLGWDKIIQPAQEDLTYKAVYLERINVYNVKFVDDDGTVLQEMELQYGQVPVYTLKNPLKESNDQYTYQFNGWDKEIEPVKSDVVYKAVYSNVVNAYKVTFMDLKGNVLYENNFEYGVTPTYEGVLPSLDGNEQYSYLFSGWDKELSPVNGDTIYRAQFEQVVNEYNVRFLDADGEVLQEGKVPYGTIPTCTATLPVLPSNTAQYSYEASWDKEVVAVTEDATYKFVVKQTINKYNVKFVFEDGSLLLEKEYEYGQMPVYDLETPVKENTIEFGYEFLGWDKEIETVVGDVVYKAVFKETKAKYLITFLDSDGNELETKMVEYGQVPTYTANVPLPTNDLQYSYTGAWDKEFGVVTGEETYTYIINKEVNKYDVTINHLNLDGSVVLQPYKANLAFNELESYNGYYTYNAPVVEGMVPSHDYINFTVDGENLVSNIYYSEVDKLTSDTVASESLSGSGTETDPYLIQSASDMLYFQANGVGLGKVYFKLTKSIELEVPNFKIAGTFEGIFDGNNCSIRGISVNASAGKTTGLFYTISGEVKNLSIYGSVTETSVMYVGGLVYYCSGKITNCTNYCDVTSSLAGDSRVGGIVSYLVAGGNLTNCVNYGSITSAGSRVGGLVGHATAGDANNCMNYGVVTGSSDIGGIWGYAQGSKSLINACVNFGDVICSSTSKTSHNGGIIAYASIKGISDCINYGSVKSNGYSGSIAGRYNNTNPFNGCVNYGIVEGRKNTNSHSTWTTFSIVAYCTSANFVALSNCYEYGVINVIS